MTDYLAQPFERPYYAHCVWNAAVLGKRLGYEAISVAEFGVSGGNGLVLLEKYATEVSRELGIGIEVYGFDTDELNSMYLGPFENDNKAVQRGGGNGMEKSASRVPIASISSIVSYIFGMSSLVVESCG